MSAVLSRLLFIAAFALPGYAATTPSASCATTIRSQATPSAASGYVVRLVANGLTDPRGIKFDSRGALLVVESGKGITALDFDDHGGDCLTVSSKKTVIADSSLNHGLEINGTRLYASSPEAVYTWRYNPTTQANTSAPTTLVYNMSNSDHTTRTLLLSKFAPGTLVVTRGSTSNIDPLAEIESSGHAQVRSFDLNNRASIPYDFPSSGRVLAWGVRNDVGVDEEPITGGIFTVENGVDQMMRNGVDIHNTNPSEELNFLGYLNGTHSVNQGRNFGYPQCYTAWDTATIPDFKGVVGQQFAIGNISSTNNDVLCNEAHRQKARLGFHPHMAPLDILFNNAGSEAWISFHGSWDSTPPVGYKVSMVDFSNGQPVQPATSNTAAIDIVTNGARLDQCPQNCFRPVGLAWDSQGRLFFSSDATGEIYMIVRNNGAPINSNNYMDRSSSSTTSKSAAGSTATAKATSAAVSNVAGAMLSLWVAVAVASVLM